MAGFAVTGPHVRGRRPLLRTMLGEVLRRVRRDQGRTLADVARAARVSMPYLSEVERGRKEASSEVLAAICEALGVELADVLAEVGRGLAARQAVPAGVIRLDVTRIDTARTGTAWPVGFTPPAGPDQARALARIAGHEPRGTVSLLAA